MKKIILILLTIIVSTTLNAQQPIVLQLWPDGAPNSNGLSGTEEDLEGGRVANVVTPTLTVYVAKNGNGQAIVACPGGGYARLAMNHEGHDMAGWFNSLGITYAVLKYRMPNGNYEVPLSDALKAISIMREHADEWKIDPHKIGIMGSSAGGHLASTAATHYTGTNNRPDFQILFYPVISMDTKITHMGTHNNLIGEKPTKEMENRFSNELQVNDNTPKAFLMCSEDDNAVPCENSIRYFQALVKNKVQGCALHIYPIGGHGWGYRDQFIYKRQWTGELEKWLREINR